MRRVLSVLLVLAAVAGCSKKSPVNPSESCATANTARVIFQNRSTINATYDILIDGGKVATLSPQTETPALEVAAGAPHTFLFRYTNTQSLACNPLTPSLAQCSSTTYNCTF